MFDQKVYEGRTVVSRKFTDGTVRPVIVTYRAMLDVPNLEAMVHRAVRNKGHQSIDGPIKILVLSEQVAEKRG